MALLLFQNTRESEFTPYYDLPGSPIEHFSADSTGEKRGAFQMAQLPTWDYNTHNGIECIPSSAAHQLMCVCVQPQHKCLFLRWRIQIANKAATGANTIIYISLIYLTTITNCYTAHVPWE
jgi:hypothetical protein